MPRPPFPVPVRRVKATDRPSGEMTGVGVAPHDVGRARERRPRGRAARERRARVEVDAADARLVDPLEDRRPREGVDAGVALLHREALREVLLRRSVGLGVEQILLGRLRGNRAEDHEARVRGVVGAEDLPIGKDDRLHGARQVHEVEGARALRRVRRRPDGDQAVAVRRRRRLDEVAGRLRLPAGGELLHLRAVRVQGEELARRPGHVRPRAAHEEKHRVGRRRARGGEAVEGVHGVVAAAGGERDRGDDEEPAEHGPD